MSTEVAPDGSGELPSADAFDVGDAVVDVEDGDPNPATVINLPPVSCAEWEVGETTVADMNPEYDAEADVVVVAYDEDLDEAEPEWGGDAPLRLGETAVRFYAFPPGRLTPASAEESKKGAPSPLGEREGFRQLKSRLEKNNDVTTLRDRGEPVLAVTKAGREYRIRPDGSVSDGPFQDKIADVAAEYLGGES